MSVWLVFGWCLGGVFDGGWFWLKESCRSLVAVESGARGHLPCSNRRKEVVSHPSSSKWLHSHKHKHKHKHKNNTSSEC
jgi:hypothetical protein